MERRASCRRLSKREAPNLITMPSEKNIRFAIKGGGWKHAAP